MVGDHTAVNNQALTLVKKLNVKPEDNPTSQSLTKQAEATRSKLASLSGAAFDKTYMDNEVAYHKAVNTALSDTLIPNAQNAELKRCCKAVWACSRRTKSTPRSSPVSCNRLRLRNKNHGKRRAEL
jgi:predicted outer membrane protein